MATPRQVSSTPRPGMPAALTRCVCGANVLTGEAAPGLLVTVELGMTSYVMTGTSATGVPQLRESGGYPVHRCPRQSPSTGA